MIFSLSKLIFFKRPFVLALIITLLTPTLSLARASPGGRRSLPVAFENIQDEGQGLISPHACGTQITRGAAGPLILEAPHYDSQTDILLSSMRDRVRLLLGHESTSTHSQSSSRNPIWVSQRNQGRVCERGVLPVMG